MILFKNSILYTNLLYIWKTFFLIRRKKFGYIHKTAFIRYPIFIRGIHNIYLYENTHISANSTILAGRAKFVIKKNSGAAEGLTVVTGNHYSIIGRYLNSIRNEEKPDDLDKDVVVEEDVWIALNVTLCAGITVGRGAEIGAGSVCRKSIPPYAIVIGNPAKVVGFKFTPEEIVEHEKQLYSEEERIPLSKLQNNYDKYFIKRINNIKEFLK
jgi:acetyltransferase-like isoleucine patch superfamily enzyme